MTSSFLLYKNISKFLKYMAFVRTASPLTLRAYWIDLRQAYQIPASDLVETWGAQNGGQFEIQGEPFCARGPTLSEDDLLRQSRAAFTRWASLSPASRNRKAATLKSFLGWAYSESLTMKELSERITCPKVPKRLPHYLSVDEIDSLLKSFGSSAEEQREKVLILLLYGGGLRVSEACGLKWTSVDLDRGILRVLGKGSKERMVPLPAVSIAALKKLRAASLGERYVFGAEPLSPRKAYDWVRSRGQKAGLMNSLHPHSLRHSYATHLLGGGANLRILQELLGHESLQATEKYTHLGMDQLARTLEKFHPLGETAKAAKKQSA